jgi:hypothetical protein
MAARGLRSGTAIAVEQWPRDTIVPQGNTLMVNGDVLDGDPGDARASGSKLQGLGLRHRKTRRGCGARCCTSPWIVGFGGLLMARDDENYYRFSYDGANEAIQLTNARDANFEWARGFEASVKRKFNCDRNAVEGVYWELFPNTGTTTTTSADTAGALNGILNWDQLDYGLDAFLVPWTGDDFVNNSTIHMVQRENRIRNIEFNLFTYLGECNGKVACGGCSACGGAANVKGLVKDAGSRWSHDWLVGIRIFVTLQPSEVDLG